MQMPMDEMGLSSDKRCEAHRIRVVDRSDPHFGSISTTRLAARYGVQAARYGIQQPRNVVLDPIKPLKHRIALADCDELLSTGLCFYDEGDAAGPGSDGFALLTPIDVERWKCAAALFKENPPSGLWMESEGLLITNASDWPPLSQRGKTLGVTIWILFVCAAMLYGGLHAIAWNSRFRTRHERVLWRASVGVIMGFGPLTMAVYLGVISFTRLKERRQVGKESLLFRNLRPLRRFLRPSNTTVFCGCRLRLLLPYVAKSANSLAFGFFYLAVGSIFFSYCLARMFIVVECFVALLNSDPNVFAVPSWSTYLPHIT